MPPITSKMLKKFIETSDESDIKSKRTKLVNMKKFVSADNLHATDSPPKPTATKNLVNSITTSVI